MYLCLTVYCGQWFGPAGGMLWLPAAAAEGHYAREIARRHPNARVVGVDSDASAIEVAMDEAEYDRCLAELDATPVRQLSGEVRFLATLARSSRRS